MHAHLHVNFKVVNKFKVIWQNIKCNIKCIQEFRILQNKVIKGKRVTCRINVFASACRPTKQSIPLSHFISENDLIVVFLVLN